MKRFFASLLGVVVFFLLVPTCTIFIARDLVSEKSIEVALKEGFFDEVGEQTFNELINEAFADAEDIDPTVAEHFDKEEFEQEVVILITSLFKNLGDPEAEKIFDTTGLKKYFKDSIESYEKASNVDIPDEYIDEFINELDELNESNSSWQEEFGEIRFIFQAIYSNKLLVTLISAIVLCIILMFILLRDISTTLLKVKTPFMVNGVGTLLIGYGIYSVLKATEMNGGPVPIDLVKVATTPFYTKGFICVGIAIALIIISKVLKHNKSISNSNAALENLGNVNYIPNNNITNTPYNGYQNH